VKDNLWFMSSPAAAFDPASASAAAPDDSSAPFDADAPGIALESSFCTVKACRVAEDEEDEEEGCTSGTSI
jgi:hypothetical protein